MRIAIRYKCCIFFWLAIWPLPGHPVVALAMCSFELCVISPYLDTRLRRETGNRIHKCNAHIIKRHEVGIKMRAPVLVNFAPRYIAFLLPCIFGESADTFFGGEVDVMF